MFKTYLIIKLSNNAKDLFDQLSHVCELGQTSTVVSFDFSQSFQHFSLDVLEICPNLWLGVVIFLLQIFSLLTEE